MIETKRLVIRDVMMEDKLSYIEMAEEGSLNDCGFDTECRSWITEWIINAQKVSLKNDPTKDWLAYSIVLKEENVASWRAIEKTDFKLVEKKMYQDINDEKPELYRFYTMVK